MKEAVQSHLEKVILETYKLDIWDIQLEVPPKKKLWDFSFWGFQLSKELKKSPIDIVNELKTILEENTGQIIKSCETAGPYLNIFIQRNKSSSLSLLKKITLPWDLQDVNRSETIIVDYIWANMGKPLHIWHMCTPCQGQSIINALKTAGYNVISDSHICDWWIILGKLIVAYNTYGDVKKLEENAVDHLLEIYVKITWDAESNGNLDEQFRNEFKKLSQWEPKSVSLWKNFTQHSIEAMNEQLARLMVKPDFNIWESFYEWIGLPKIEDYPDLDQNMHEIVNELINIWIATKNEDYSVWVEFPEETGIPSCILQKRNGTHGYLASDLACIKYRMLHWSPEKIIYSVDVRQKLHFEQAFNIALRAWWLKRAWKNDTQMIHAYNGFISGKDWAFSTRKWNIIRLGDLLDEAEQRAKNLILEKRIDLKETDKKTLILARQIGVWAIKYWYLKKKRITDVVFDWDEFMTFEGNSGPYIQYAYVRASKILADNTIGEVDFNDMSDFSNTVALEKFENLLNKIQEFRGKNWPLQESIHLNMPHIIAQYTYDLTREFSDFYDKVRVGSERDANMKNAFLHGIKAYSKNIKDCFNILGIELPSEM